MMELQKCLPYENMIYYADNANNPYGPKNKDEIITLSKNITEFLLTKKVKAIVVACNTATGAAISYLRSKYDLPFIGIEPAIKPASKNSKTGVIGVLATEGTFNADHFKKTAENFASDKTIIVKAAHGLVEIVEKGLIDLPESELVIQDSVAGMIENRADQIVLGCTHYPFLMPIIKKYVGEEVEVINPAPAVAKQTVMVLNKFNLNSKNRNKPFYDFYCSAQIGVLKSMVLKYMNCETAVCDFYENHNISPE